MFDRVKKLFNKTPKQRFTAEQYEHYDGLKKQGLEAVLGNMYDRVLHAIIPFQVGGALDIYCFPTGISGTGLATMELIEPDGSGPVPSTHGTFEMIAFTSHRVGDEAQKAKFDEVQLRLRRILTVLARYSLETRLNPLETVEIPGGDGQPNNCLILDEYTKPGVEFTIGGKKHCLLLVIEVFRSEMDYAMQNGPLAVLCKLKEKGLYPYSDLDREPIF